MNIRKIIYYGLLALVAVAALFLVGSMLPISGNYKILVVKSGSMEPSISTGSVVVVKPSTSYQIGEVITFGESSKTKTPTTHRIVEMRVDNGQAIYLTKGDANNAPDQKTVSHKEIIGKVLFDVPLAGYLVAFGRTRLGFALIIIIPALVIIIEEIWKIKNEIRKNQKNSRPNQARREGSESNSAEGSEKSN